MVKNMNCNDLFEFKETEDGYVLSLFLQHKNDKITEIEIPAEYNDRPVVRIGNGAFAYAKLIESVQIPAGVKTIGDSAFFDCVNLSGITFPEGLKTIGKAAFTCCENCLRSVALPKSLESIGYSAFEYCWALENVTFLNPDTRFGQNIFFGCPNLLPEIRLMSLVCSCDITRPIAKSVYTQYAERNKPFGRMIFQSDPLLSNIKIFELAVKNKCFREANDEELFALLSAMIEGDLREHLRLAEEGGLLSNAPLTDKLIGYSTEQGNTEITARLLEYKNRKIGFNGEQKYEL